MEKNLYLEVAFADASLFMVVKDVDTAFNMGINASRDPKFIGTSFCETTAPVTIRRNYKLHKETR